MVTATSASHRPSLQRRINMLPRWPLYIGGAIPGLWIFWLALNNKLGADPVSTLEHLLGLWALRFILAGLVITPLRRLGGPSLICSRRALGLVALFYAPPHLLAYLAFDRGPYEHAVHADIIKRPYIPIRMLQLAI